MQSMPSEERKRSIRLILSRSLSIILTLYFFVGCPNPTSTNDDEAVTGDPPGETVENRSYDTIDEWAFNAPQSAATSVAELATYLVEPCEDDFDKARVIYSWLAANISYDTESYFGDTQAPQDANSVLNSGIAVCAGYANLYQALADQMSLQVITISGHGKGYSYSEGAAITPNHAWNAFNVEGSWHLLDSTWGAGYVDNDQQYCALFKEYWFDVDPDEMIFTHFPMDPAAQHTERTFTKNEYSELPPYDPTVFRGSITPEAVLEALDDPNFTGLPQIYGSSADELGFEPVDIPLNGSLNMNTQYEFRFKMSLAGESVMSYDGEFHYALAEGEEPANTWQTYDGLIDPAGVFSFTVEPKQAGSVAIMGTASGTSNGFYTIVVYDVR